MEQLVEDEGREETKKILEKEVEQELTEKIEGYKKLDTEVVGE